MERIFVRETAESEPLYFIEKQKIGVVGMSRGAGATLLATSLAREFSCRDGRKVTFLEVCCNACKKTPLIYDSIGADKRFRTREFVRFYNEIKQGGGIRGKNNIDDRINWGLITPGDVKEEIQLTPLETVRLINNIPGDLIICDISECGNAEDFLLDMDCVIVVIDPMPSRMIAGYPFMREIKRLEHRGMKVIWLVNKFNPGINKKDMQDFLKLKEFCKIPFIPESNFYSAEYNCKIPYDLADIRREMKETLEKVIGIIV